jgi:hypothetical protein
LKCGYLEKLEYSFFGGVSWKQMFCVLTNVGLLYFTNPLLPPTDLFPVVDCKIDKVAVNEEGYHVGYHSIKLVYSTKKIVLRCLSKTDYESWFKSIWNL